MNLPQKFNWGLGVKLITCWHVQIVNKIDQDLRSGKAKYILCLLINFRFNIPLHPGGIRETIKIDICMINLLRVHIVQKVLDQHRFSSSGGPDKQNRPST